MLRWARLANYLERILDTWKRDFAEWNEKFYYFFPGFISNRN